MIDHTGLQVSAPERSRRFYDRALAPLGYSLLMRLPPAATGGAAVYGYGVAVSGRGVAPEPDFWVIEGTPNEPRVHVAFRADSRREVDEFHRAALAAGGRDNGPPGPRPQYHEHYYGAFVLDPDGHNIEAVCHAPAAATSHGAER